MIVVGIRPWGSHGQNVHSLFAPLVDELRLLYDDGIHVQTHGRPPDKLRHVKCLLLLVACDLPAAKQLGGFSAHNAVQGCHRCSKEFRKPDAEEEEEEEEEKEEEKEEEEDETDEDDDSEEDGDRDAVHAQPVWLWHVKGAAPREVITPPVAPKNARRGTYFGAGVQWNVEDWQRRYAYAQSSSVTRLASDLLCVCARMCTCAAGHDVCTYTRLCLAP
jgi:hypothetical protein